MDKTLNMPVMVYYCECGKSIEEAGNPKYIAMDRKCSNRYRKMEEQGRKVEIMTKKQFLKKPFLCKGVRNCPNPPKENKANSMNWDEN